MTRRHEASSLTILLLVLALSGCHLDGRTLTVDTSTASGVSYSQLSLLAGSLETPGFSAPSAIAGCGVYTAGDQFAPFCVGDGHRILRISRDTDVVAVVAGSNDQPFTKDGVGAAAGFGGITDMTSDLAGSLYVVDGCAIRKVVVDTGEVTTVASNVNAACGTADGVVLGMPAAGPSHVHYCPSTKSLFVSDGPALRQVDVTSGAVTDVPGPSGQPWASPSGAAGPVLCESSSLYVADGSVIQLVDLASWSWKPMPGTYSAGGTPITSLSADGDYLYVLEGSVIWRLNVGTSDGTVCLPTSTSGATPPEPALGCPYRVAGGLHSIAIYETDPCTHSIQLIDCQQQAETTLVAGARLGAADGDGATARFEWPTGITTTDAGDTFVVDVDSVRRISATGESSTLAKAAIVGPPDESWPIGVVSDGAGALYVADAVGGTIRKIVIETGAVSTLADRQGMIRLPRPTSLAIDRQRAKLYVGDVLDHTIRGVDMTTGEVKLIAGQPYTPGGVDGDAAHATLLFPAGLALAATSLLVADAGSKTIRMVVLETGEVKTIAGAVGTPGTAGGNGLQARFMEPIAIALDGQNRLFVVDRLAGAVSRLELSNGDVTNVSTIIGAPATGASLPQPATIPGSVPAQLYLPQAIAVGASNELLISVPNALLIAR